MQKRSCSFALFRTAHFFRHALPPAIVGICLPLWARLPIVNLFFHISALKTPNCLHGTVRVTCMCPLPVPSIRIRIASVSSLIIAGMHASPRIKYTFCFVLTLSLGILGFPIIFIQISSGICFFVSAPFPPLSCKRLCTQASLPCEPPRALRRKQSMLLL